MSRILASRPWSAASMCAAFLSAGTEARATDYVGSTYRLYKVELHVDGQWRPVRETAPGQFLFVYQPAGPKHFNVKVTWSPRPSGGGPTTEQWLDDPCRGAWSPARIVVKLDGQVQPGPVVAVTSSRGEPFSYVFQNVTRGASHTLSASCEERGRNVVYRSGGSATLNFQPNALLGWNPGLDLSGPDWLLIESPSEGQVLPRNNPLSVRVRATKRLRSELPAKLGVEVERGVDAQTGVVGDIALPANKAYGHQWTPVETVWRTTYWFDRSPDSICTLDLTGYLGNPRTPEHPPGIYRTRVLMPGGEKTPWRSFQVPDKVVLRKAK